jgi:hypothetical protein
MDPKKVYEYDIFDLDTPVPKKPEPEEPEKTTTITTNEMNVNGSVYREHKKLVVTTVDGSIETSTLIHTRSIDGLSYTVKQVERLNQPTEETVSSDLTKRHQEQLEAKWNANWNANWN